MRSVFVSRAINKGRNTLTIATLHMLFDFDKTLSALVNCCQLEQLTILDDILLGQQLTKTLNPAKRLKKLHLNGSARFRPSELRHLFKTLSDRLESFSCCVKDGRIGSFNAVKSEKLRDLSITYDGVEDISNILVGISDRMPALESLAVRHSGSPVRMLGPAVFVDLEKCSHLRNLDLAVPEIAAPKLKLPKTLIRLALTTTDRFWDNRNGVPPPFDLPQLEELTVMIPFSMRTDVSSRTWLDPFLEQVRVAEHVNLALSVTNRFRSLKDMQTTEPPSKLRKLSLEGKCLDPLDSHDRAFLKHNRLSHLEELHLPRIQGYDDNFMELIVETLPHLWFLNASETAIDGVDVKVAVQSGHIRELWLNDCRRLGRDAVDWARSQGVSVRARMPDSGFGGKKIRW